MIRSLRWRLQLWHALLLTTVLVIFGVVVYALQWQTRLQQIDAELDRVASVLTSRLRGLFPVPRMPNQGSWPPRSNGRQNSQRPAGEENSDRSTNAAADALAPANVPPWARDGRGGVRPGVLDARPPGRERSRDGNRNPGPGRSGEIEPPPREGPRESGSDVARSPGSGGAPGRDSGGRDTNGRNPWFDPPPGLGLPDEFKHLFEGDEQHNFYYTIWDRNGIVLDKSKSVGDIPFPDLHTPNDGLPVRMVRMRDLRREVVHVSRFDINVLVGRSIIPDLAARQRSGMLLILTGLGVLAIGLAGGWWFSYRAFRPITEMSAIAESISVKNLSSRIKVRSTASELGQLATVLNRTFDRLESSFQRQSEFTADASHELRTPVSVILSNAELALSRPRSSEEYQKALQACRRASLRMKSLIDSLLLLARFDSGEPEIERQPVDLEKLARDAIDLLQPLADERQIRLNLRAEPVTFDADPERLFQMLTNLLSNAIRYNRTEGKVDVEVTSDDRFAVVRVIDTGVGIPAEDLPRIFDRFYRVDKARSRAEGGSGLGLAICQTIVEAHGGTISVTSEAGTGTTIEVRLPLVKQELESVLPDQPAQTESDPVAAG